MKNIEYKSCLLSCCMKLDDKTVKVQLTLTSVLSSKTSRHQRKFFYLLFPWIENCTFIIWCLHSHSDLKKKTIHVFLITCLIEVAKPNRQWQKMGKVLQLYFLLNKMKEEVKQKQKGNRYTMHVRHFEML